MPSPADPQSRERSDCVARLMFDYEMLSEPDIVAMCALLPRKVVRWIGANHPDNCTRLKFFELTGVAIGEGTVINANLTIYDDYLPLVSFGSRVAVAADVTIVASSSPNNSRLAANSYVRRHLITNAPVRICNDVWLGAACILLPGVTIGEQSIVAAGAVVSRDVAPHTVVAGVPARRTRSLDGALRPLDGLQGINFGAG